MDRAPTHALVRIGAALSVASQGDARHRGATRGPFADDVTALWAGNASSLARRPVQ